MGDEPPGSSPRMWGTLTWNENSLLFVRIIPTHVGNTQKKARSFRTEADHPHACGEHAIAVWIAVIIDGSSPRMWGTPICRELATQEMRIIPTHVGNTCYRHCLWMRWRRSFSSRSQNLFDNGDNTTQ